MIKFILHIDADCFFVSCELAQRPWLKGKPVVTGKERGIASAMSYEAKARGITRGMPVYQIRKLCPDVVVLPSDYETYSLFSKRMFEIVRRFTPHVEEYSIDECFALLRPDDARRFICHPELARDPANARYIQNVEHLIRTVKHTLESELGLTFSLGLAPNKVLAKVASKWNKPSGYAIIPPDSFAGTNFGASPISAEGPISRSQFLERVATRDVWGIGPATSAKLGNFGIQTAGEFAARPRAWVEEHFAKPYVEIWHELNGRLVYPVETAPKESYESISKTKTFTPPSADPALLFAQLAKNAENACIKARRHSLAAREVSFFLKTQDFNYHSTENIRLISPTNTPQDILHAMRPYFDAALKGQSISRPAGANFVPFDGTNIATGREQISFRSTGITLSNLTSEQPSQANLFGTDKWRDIYRKLDSVSAKYGKHAVFLGSSLGARGRPQYAGERGEGARRKSTIFKGETARRRLGVPYLGEVG